MQALNITNPPAARSSFNYVVSQGQACIAKDLTSGLLLSGSASSQFAGACMPHTCTISKGLRGLGSDGSSNLASQHRIGGDGLTFPVKLSGAGSPNQVKFDTLTLSTSGFGVCFAPSLLELLGYSSNSWSLPSLQMLRAAIAAFDKKSRRLGLTLR